MKNIIFIENVAERIPHEDIYLMSLCKNNIVGGGGAWLNENKNKVVIAPKRWFADSNLEQQGKDIVCDDWVRI